ncbi:hypothetical protein M0804_000249 [Polistes exclamans]|nr:hypothetical protein M0804_000249 [Polistes exclamans]
MIELQVKISPCYVLPRGSQFQLIEPVTTRKPKFSSESKITSYERLIDHDTTLLCPAQGFPVPTYRGSQFQLIEPVAAKKPKLSSDFKMAWYDRIVDQDLTLFCPVKGFPVPIYRTSGNEETKVFERH